MPRAAGDEINKGHVDEMAIVEKIEKKLRTKHKEVCKSGVGHIYSNEET